MGTGGNRPLTDEQKYKILLRALRRIANLEHAANCRMTFVPLFECSCLVNPVDTARDALNNIGEGEQRWKESW